MIKMAFTLVFVSYLHIRIATAHESLPVIAQFLQLAMTLFLSEGLRNA